MARGTSTRAPSQNAYKGSVGQTRSEIVHVTGPSGELVAATVHTGVDAVSHPDLVERLHAGTLNTLRIEGSETPLGVPLVYHDPAAEVFALVLGDAQRHREIDERIRLLERLRDDAAAVPVYVKDFSVVFGAAGLRKLLETKAQALLSQRETSKEQDRKHAALVAREAELQRAQQQIAQQQAELERSRAELERNKAELERMRAEARARVIAAVQDATTVSPTPAARTKSSEHDEIVTKPVKRQDIDDLEHALARAMPAVTTTRKNDFEVDPATQFETEPATGIDLPSHAPGSNGTSLRPSSVVTFDDSEKTGDDGKVPSELDVEPELETGGFTPPVEPELETGGFTPPVEPELETGGFTPPVEVDDEPTGTSSVPSGSDPLTTETLELAADKSGATKSSTSVFTVKDGSVRLALVVGDALARGLTAELDVRILLHRLSTYPVVVVLVGPPAALRTPSPGQLIVVPLDIAADTDRAVLTALAKKFEITADIIVRGTATRRVRLTAPLAENVAYIIRAADDHLRGITADGETEPSYEHARDIVLGPGYDLLGAEHAESSEFRDDKLAALTSAQHVRRAVAIARRFARPSREDYLVCARGYPLSRWRELRRQVLERAVAWGLWMGPELAQVAVSEGLARSRRDLIMKLDSGFEALRRDVAAFDIDDDAADDNTKSIAEEARALGVELRQRKSNGAIKSEDVPTVSGSIERKPTAGLPVVRTLEELVKLLDDKVQRVSAATELCERGDPRAAAPVIAAVKKMSRAEAVRILGRSVKFGPAAAAPLIEGLSSSKAFLRHGCALALALLRTDEGTHAVVEQLMNEPTEVWREVARALGQVGPTALMPLASHVGRLGDRMTPALQERVAWAMAHVGVRGGKPALEQMAAGQSVMAPIARQALSLHENAAQDEVRVRPGPQAGKDVTVNRAFSRRFFEALEADRPEVAQAALHDLEASGPLELLDESDLIEDEDDEAELDESDLIQT